MKKDRIGEKHITKEGYNVQIIDSREYKDYAIQFEGGFIITTTYQNIKKGQVKNPYHPSVCGVGYLGTGAHKTKISGKNTKVYKVWTSMLQRSYCNKWLRKHTTYLGCSVHPDWHNFQTFAEWFEQNYKEGQELDKDVLVKGNKIYSPKTCCFIPQSVNLVIIKNNIRRGNYPIGVSKWKSKFKATLHKEGIYFYLGLFDTLEEAFQTYKIEKEVYIKEVAEKHKNQITENCYQALINYKVEIND